MISRERRVDLNADLGEGETTDAQLLEIVSSCNVACGGHTGDKDSMATTVSAAQAAGVAVGAHPSYPDREGFGRRSAYLTASEIGPAIAGQVGDLLAVATTASVRVGHVKPHGALYNDAARNRELADAICQSICTLDRSLSVVGPPGSELEASARHAGLDFVAEGFVDRAYQSDGALVPRSHAGAVYTDPAEASQQATDIAVTGTVGTRDGGTLALPVQTLCIHGDTPGAVAIARAVRDALEAAGLTIACRFSRSQSAQG